eukprot:1158937-Pelagomonas_calceolata.AAC.10
MQLHPQYHHHIHCIFCTEHPRMPTRQAQIFKIGQPYEGEKHGWVKVAKRPGKGQGKEQGQSNR